MCACLKDAPLPWRGLKKAPICSLRAARRACAWLCWAAERDLSPTCRGRTLITVLAVALFQRATQQHSHHAHDAIFKSSDCHACSYSPFALWGLAEGRVHLEGYLTICALPINKSWLLHYLARRRGHRLHSYGCLTISRVCDNYWQNEGLFFLQGPVLVFLFFLFQQCSYRTIFRETEMGKKQLVTTQE